MYKQVGSCYQLYLIQNNNAYFSLELRVGFTEVDYYESESEGCLAVAVFRDGQLSKDVVISIHPMTYLQFAENNLTLPDLKHFQHLPDPAECKIFQQACLPNRVWIKVILSPFV